MIIHRKLLIGLAAVAIALFIASNPLGDAHHGLGRHNQFAADAGQTLFVASLLGVALLVVLSVVGLIQFVLRSTSDRR
jgi:hypothetical protein